MGCNTFWGKFSCEAIRALTYLSTWLESDSQSPSRIESERIGIYLVAIYGKLNMLGQYIRRASWTFYGILYTLNIGPTARRRKIHQCQGYDEAIESRCISGDYLVARPIPMITR